MVVGPAPENVTSKIFELSKSITEYRYVRLPEVDVDQIGTRKYENLIVEVVDSVNDYVALMKQIFDFDLIKTFIKSRPDFKLLFDGMHGVTGPYGKRIFVDELGLPVGSVMNFVPLHDFGGGHPDPNLTYAKELVDTVRAEKIDFGAASDGDGDRNMIIAHDAFVNPSDSVAGMCTRAS